MMDGHYVPNITFGASTVAAISAACNHPLHVHLMIEDPMKYAQKFVEAGAARISFHPEVVADPSVVVHHIRGLGAGAGVAVHPDRDLADARELVELLDVILVMTVRPGFGGQSFLDDVVPKITEARALAEGSDSSPDIEVDGGVNMSTVERTVRAGAGVVVAGSAIFDGVDPAGAARRLRARLDELEMGDTS